MLSKFFKQVFFFLSLSLFLFSNAAFAQQVIEPPASADAATIESQVNRDARKQLLSRPERPQIVEPERPQQAAVDQDISFYVDSIEIAGNEAIPTSDLVVLISNYEGKEIKLSEANDLASEIQNIYRTKGFVTAICYVPPQKVKDQKLLIQVVEGKVGKTIIEGNKWFSEKSIRRYSRLKEGENLKYEQLAVSVRRMNENPDRSVQAIMRPGEDTGSTDIYLKVQDRFPLHAGFQFDQQGVRSTGRKRIGFNARHTNFIIPDSTLQTGTVFGKDFGVVYAQYLIPIGPFGTQLIPSFSYSSVAPKRASKGSDIQGISKTYSLTLRQLLFENERITSHAQAVFDFKDNVTTSVIGTSRRDRLRILRPSIEGTVQDRYGVTRLNGELSFGIQGFGASGVNNPFSGRRGAEPNLARFNGSISRSQIMPFGTQANIDLEFQLSKGKLFPQEQFYLGGANTVRGYPEGDYLADQGVLASIEYVMPAFFIPKNLTFPFTNTVIKDRMQLLSVLDAAYGRLKGPSQFEVRSRFLLGAGAGLRMRLYKYMFLDLIFAHALGNEPLTESDHSRLHFTIRMDI